MEWQELHKTLWDLRNQIEPGPPMSSVKPESGMEGPAALAALRSAEEDELAAFESWLQKRGPLFVEGVGATLLDLRLEAAANLARALDQAALPVPPEWTERYALSWLARELHAVGIQPALDRVWLGFHGLSEDGPL